MENLEIKDKFLLLGHGSTSPLNDIGIQFGQSPTQSNSLFYKGTDPNGRLAYGYNEDHITFNGLTSNHYPMTVFSGSAEAAALVKANQTGMMRIDSENEIYLHI